MRVKLEDFNLDEAYLELFEKYELKTFQLRNMFLFVSLWSSAEDFNNNWATLATNTASAPYSKYLFIFTHQKNSSKYK